MTDQPGNNDAGRDSGPSGDPTSPLDFDPYRFGKPEHPVPPEYAPPGYVPPTPSEPVRPSRPVWPPQDASGKQAYPPPSPYGGYPPQQPYGGYTPHPPPPPGYPPYGQVRPGTGKATTALVLGILSIVLFALTVLDLALAVPAIVLGALAIRDANRYPDRPGRGRALAGLICGVVGVVLVVVTIAVVYPRIQSCLHYGFTSDRYQSCINQKL